MKQIIDLFKIYRDDKKIPNLSPKQWKELNNTYDKETIIAALIEYIKEEQPEPPINRLDYHDMAECFFKLKKTDPMKFFLDHDSVKENVLEKYEDYGRSYKDYGLGVVQMGNSYIDVSNYFNQTLRMECDTYGFKSAHHRWKEAEDLRTVFLALWRLGNDRLNEHSFVVAFRLATYIATQFKPHVAKFIYDISKAETVFDSSMGWGDRLAGFYCSNAKVYIGCDPNPETFEMYIIQATNYERLLGAEPIVSGYRESNGSFVEIRGKKTVCLYRSAAEDLFGIIKDFPKIDCAFTSPPYFSTELYNSGGQHEDDQSWKRYDTYEKWRDNFYLPVNEKTFEHLSDKGLMIVNIMDPKVKGKRYYASDDLIDAITTKYKDCKFIGQLGMRIMQRPKNISKTLLQKHFDKIYIEPMWVFGKNRDYFMKKSRGLLDFMS